MTKWPRYASSLRSGTASIGAGAAQFDKSAAERDCRTDRPGPLWHLRCCTIRLAVQQTTVHTAWSTRKTRGQILGKRRRHASERDRMTALAIMRPKDTERSVA